MALTGSPSKHDAKDLAKDVETDVIGQPGAEADWLDSLRRMAISSTNQVLILRIWCLYGTHWQPFQT
jgi:hypothetical protein